jgi:hypothetical protein
MDPLLANIGMLIAILCTDKDTFDPVGWYYGAISFVVFVMLVFTFKTLQHWNDLKNHTSR